MASVVTSDKVIVEKTPEHYAEMFVKNADRLIENLMTVLPPAEAATCGFVRFLMCKQLPPEKVVNEFIIHSKTFWHEIDTGNDEFFINADHANKIFGNISSNRVLDFKKYWTQLKDDEKDTVRQFFKKFVKFARLYESSRDKKKND